MADEKKPWWKFEPVVNLGHVLTVLALLGGGISVYVGVFQTLTELVLRVKTLEATQIGAETRRQMLFQNNASIDELKTAITDIRTSNAKMLEQLTGIRIDIAVFSKRTDTRAQ